MDSWVGYKAAPGVKDRLPYQLDREKPMISKDGKRNNKEMHKKPSSFFSITIHTRLTTKCLKFIYRKLFSGRFHVQMSFSLQ